jgi:hypothetical protein
MKNMKKKIFKDGDVIFIGTESFKIEYSTDEDYGISNQNYHNDVPKSLSDVFSFTPYHFEGDYLVGFTQVRPWQPKIDEVVCGWDEGDQQKYIGLYAGCMGGFHELKTTKPIKDGKKPIIECFEFVEPF